MNSTLLMYIVRGFILLVCMPVHECAHAWTANRLGDPTGKNAGRITLNPARHLSLIGTIMILAVGMGYAKPVPVNINNFPYEKRKKYFAITAAAGPISNMIMAAIFVFAAQMVVLYVVKTGHYSEAVSNLYLILGNAAMVNISLAVFNMIPFPPLDGSRLFTAFLPDSLYYKLLSNERYMMGALFILMFILHRAGISPVSWIAQKVFYGLSALIGLPFGL